MPHAAPPTLAGTYYPGTEDQDLTPGRPQVPPGRTIERARYVFHELHADGRHPLCDVCGS